jgi:hypothetical protein
MGTEIAPLVLSTGREPLRLSMALLLTFASMVSALPLMGLVTCSILMLEVRLEKTLFSFLPSKLGYFVEFWT